VVSAQMIAEVIRSRGDPVSITLIGTGAWRTRITCGG
jgi:hypothetical protein